MLRLEILTDVGTTRFSVSIPTIRNLQLVFGSKVNPCPCAIFQFYHIFPAVSSLAVISHNIAPCDHSLSVLDSPWQLRHFHSEWRSNFRYLIWDSIVYSTKALQRFSVVAGSFAQTLERFSQSLIMVAINTGTEGYMPQILLPTAGGDRRYIRGCSIFVPEGDMTFQSKRNDAGAATRSALRA